MRKFLLLTLVCSALGLTGCTSSKYSQVIKEPVTTVMEQNPGKAVVAIYRNKLQASGFAVPVAVYKADTLGYQYIGVLSLWTYTATALEPGEYIFVTGGQGQSAARVNVEANRLYSMGIIYAPKNWHHAFDFYKGVEGKKLVGYLNDYNRVIPNVLGEQHPGNVMKTKVGHIQRLGAPTDFLLTPEDGMPFEEVKALFDKDAGK